MSWSKGLISTEKLNHKEYSCEISKLSHLLFKRLYKRFSSQKVGQTSRSRSQDQNCWYPQKGLVRMITHVKY